MLNQAITNQSASAAKDADKNRHLFIDLMCYEDLQLLKARRGQSLQLSSSSSY